MSKEEKAREYADNEVRRYHKHSGVIEKYGMERARMLSQHEAWELEEAFEKGWDEALRSQWISVEERLPELMQRVLVAHILNKKISICIMKRIPHDTTNPSNKKWHWSLTNYKEDVLAWMPIPSFEDILEGNTAFPTKATRTS